MSTTDPVHLRLHQHKALHVTPTPSTGITVSPGASRDSITVLRSRHAMSTTLGFDEKCLMPMRCFFFSFLLVTPNQKTGECHVHINIQRALLKGWSFLKSKSLKRPHITEICSMVNTQNTFAWKKKCSKHLQSISSVSTLNFQRRTKDRHDFCQNPTIPKFQQKWRLFTRQLVTMCRIYSNQPPLTFARSFCLRSFVASTSQRWGSDPPWPQDGFGITFETLQLW